MLIEYQILPEASHLLVCCSRNTVSETLGWLVVQFLMFDLDLRERYLFIFLFEFMIHFVMNHEPQFCVNFKELLLALKLFLDFRDVSFTWVRSCIAKVFDPSNMLHLVSFVTCILNVILKPKNRYTVVLSHFKNSKKKIRAPIVMNLESVVPEWYDKVTPVSDTVICCCSLLKWFVCVFPCHRGESSHSSAGSV